MRINSLKIEKWSGIKRFEAKFEESDNIICIIDEREDPFGDDFPEVFKKLFLDSYKFVSGHGNGKIECACTRENVQLYIELRGKVQPSEIVYNGQKMCGCIDGIEEVCYYPVKVSRKIGRRINLDFREVLYSTDLREFCFFDRRIPLDLEELVASIENEWAEMACLTDEEWTKLKQKKNEFIEQFEGIVFDEKYTLKVNSLGELVLQDGYGVAMDIQDRFTDDEYTRMRFLEWIIEINLIKDLCEHVEREGDQPVFVEGVFEKLQKGKKEILFENLRKTGRQVFIFLYNRDEEIEKYCDKVITVTDD